MPEVKRDDTQLKKFLERTLCLEILHASFTRGTLTYTMRSKDGETVVLEQKPDTSISIRVNEVTRTIPTKVEVGKALGHEPTELEVCRLIQQVYDKIREEQEDADSRSIRGDFRRFSRRGW